MTYIKVILLSLPLVFTACNKYPEANMTNEPLEKPLEIAKEPKIVAMTNSMTVAVKKDGTLWTWGTGSDLLRDIKTKEEGYTPVQVKGVTDAVAVSADSHILVLKKDGTVWGWGGNHNKQIMPNNDALNVNQMTKIKDIDDVVDISAGNNESVFVKADGSVYVLGENNKGWVNNKKERLEKPTKVEGLNNIIRAEIISGVLLALNKNGEVFSTGRGHYALGRDNYEKKDDNAYFYPKKVQFEKKVVDFDTMASGAIVLLSDGTVWTWGAPTAGQLGIKTNDFIQLPNQITSLSRIVNIAEKSAIDIDGNLYIWGEIFYGLNTNELSRKKLLPTKIAENIKPLFIVYEMRSATVLDVEGNLYYWNWNISGQRGTGEKVDSVKKDYILTPEKSLWNYYD